MLIVSTKGFNINIKQGGVSEFANVAEREKDYINNTNTAIVL